MVGSRQFRSLWTLFALAMGLPSCSTDLRRDDLAGRPCPCLVGWTEQEVGNSCICVLSNGGTGMGGSASGGTSTSGNHFGGAQMGGTSASGGAADSGGTSSTQTPAGGSIATGGKVAQGGTSTVMTITGGNVATGGTPGQGGTSGSCPAPLPPPQEPAICPSQCSACANGICSINCIASSGCSNVTLNCPANMPCQVNCAADSSCNALYLYCPAQYSCAVNCSGKKSCVGLNATCSADGPCALTCASDTQVCSSAQLNCGKNYCKASCPGTKGSFPTVNQCTSSCQPNCGCP